VEDNTPDAQLNARKMDEYHAAVRPAGGHLMTREGAAHEGTATDRIAL
jgi:hypothetical protein